MNERGNGGDKIGKKNAKEVLEAQNGCGPIFVVLRKGRNRQSKICNKNYCLLQIFSKWPKFNWLIIQQNWIGELKVGKCI